MSNRVKKIVYIQPTHLPVKSNVSVSIETGRWKGEGGGKEED